MKKIFVSDVWNINNSGHENLDFVDVALNKDNLLFIDPCLIENWDIAWAKKAMCTINSFFSEFYSAYRDNDRLLKHSLLSHAREQNATRLGYGRGDNGKGNTPEGLMNDFRPLESLIHKIDTIGIPQDLTVLIPGFAEDGFSDLLTNIIHSELNDFTLTQMNKYNIAPNSTTTFYSWDSSLQNWVQVESPCYRYGKDELLLVPKQIVRKNYLFGIGQYFERIILERKQAEDNWRDDKGKPIPKREIAKNLRTDDEHWQYKYAIDYSQKHMDALEEYHRKLPSYYFEYGQPLDDDFLDEIIYTQDAA
ncbi:MAG: hypothetical protein KIC52_02820 [Firmicutes bacterium]|nr:hypothetical protein [Bacillota bacterium]